MAGSPWRVGVRQPGQPAAPHAGAGRAGRARLRRRDDRQPGLDGPGWARDGCREPQRQPRIGAAPQRRGGGACHLDGSQPGGGGALQERWKSRALHGIDDKASALKKLLADSKIDPASVVYVGNDLNDLPCFPIAGWSVAVADALPEVLREADFVLTQNGGHGAVRELCDLIHTEETRFDL